MKNIISIILVVSLGLFYACENPEDFSGVYTNEGVQLITATFMDRTGGFYSEGTLPFEEIISIPFPFYYPEESSNEIDISQMRLTANLPNNVSIMPGLSVHDLRNPIPITVKAANGTITNHTIVGEIRKSSKAEILEFSFPEIQMGAFVLESQKVVGFVPGGMDMLGLKPEVRVSPHATVSPEPSLPQDFNEPVVYTVTAHDGTQVKYTVQAITPKTLASGIRPGSAKMLFAKRLKADFGIDANNLTGGIAVTNDYVVINTRNENSIFINKLTGEKLGVVELGDVKGSLRNFYSTADRNNNILICNLAPNDGAFKVWKLSSVTASPELIIEWDGGEAIGRKLSINGSLDGNAIISAPLLGTAEQRFARWTVLNGQLTSQIPDVVTLSGLERGWTTNADLVYTSDSDVNSDYFVASYSDNTFAWVNGANNQIRAKLDEIDRNFIMNAVDFIPFNNARYVVTSQLNSFTWGSADIVWLLDVSTTATFAGHLRNRTVDAVVWESERAVFGGNAVVPPVANANGTSDVALSVSEDGFFLYLYFMFTNGYVVGYQFDCIDVDNIL